MRTPPPVRPAVLARPAIEHERVIRPHPGSSLFPEAGPSDLPLWLVGLGYAGLFVMASAASLLRQPGLAATKTVWAEDGRIFYAQSTTLPVLRTFTTLHNGYMQLFPRLAAQLARFVPVGKVSTLFALTGAISLGLLCCLVFHMAKGHIASPGLRALLAAGMVLLPIANVELLNNLVNVPWWLFFAAFWALLWRPTSWWGRAVAGLVCFLAAASEPLVGLFLPLALARWAILRHPREQTGGAGLVLGLIYQAAVILPAGTKALSSPGGLNGIGQSFAVRVGLETLGGVRGSDWLLVNERQLSIVWGIMVIGVIVLFGLYARSTRPTVLTVVMAVYSALCFVLPVWLRGVAGAMQIGTVRIAGRYQAVPILLLVSAVLLLADHYARAPASSAPSSPWMEAFSSSPASSPWDEGHQSSGGVLRAAAAVVLCAAMFVPSWVADFRGPNQRSAGPAWATEVAQAARTCRRSGEGMVEVRIDPPHWTAVLPCRVVAPGRDG